MSEPQFIPSGKPHSVEVAEGSHVAKSKSANVGTEVRQNVRDKFAQGQEIEVDAHQIVLTSSAAGADNMVKVPRGDAIERASQSIAASASSERASKAIKPSTASGSNRTAKAGQEQTAPRERPVYETEMQEMNFPARVIHLKVENDAVRAQLEDLQSLMGAQANDSDNSK